MAASGMQISDFVGDGPIPHQATQWPTVVTIVPARNEADVIERTLRSLLKQNYPGEFHVVMVDDHSDDGTAEIARQLAIEHPAGAHLTVKAAEDRPSGWLGKMWAVHTGLQFAEETLAWCNVLVFDRR